MQSKQATQSRQAREGLSYATALRDCLRSGLILINGTLKLTLVTREAEQILALPPGLGAPPAFETLPPPLQNLARETLTAGKPLARTVELNAQEGAPRALRVIAAPVQLGKADAGAALVINDLTSARQLEEHVQQLDRLADIGTLAASMAHEIKNALVAGKTFIELLLEKNQEAELVEVVRRELSRIDAIVSRMLRFAAPGQLAFSPLNLHEVLEHSLRLVQPQLEAGGIVVQRSFLAAPDRVNGDEYELQQAFVNLLLNALEAMSTGGTLTIVTDNVAENEADPNGDALPSGRRLTRARASDSRCREDRSTSASGCAPNRIRVCITDTGTGVPPENIGRLFEPFFTTKPSGTGLGLPITQRIIHEHRGAITAESRTGQGTTFQLVLPLLEEAG